MTELPVALAALAAYRQFLCYALVPSKTRPGKIDKIPVSPHTGQVCTAHDPANWTDAAHACQVATSWGAGFGVAFSFQASDPFWFIDIDHCRDAAGVWSPLALEIAAAFPGAAMEVSQSGTGLHIIGRGSAPPHGCKNVPLGLEFYTELRFVALTGIGAVGDAGTDHTAALHALTARYFQPSPGMGAPGSVATLSDGPVPEWRGPTDDADLIRRAMASKSAGSAFGGRASFADLWLGNVEALGRAYPDGGGRPFDASSADSALASHLAFWTGHDGERIARLMRQSALVRDKYERDDYLPRTIGAVLAMGGDVLQDKPREPAAVAAASPGGPELRTVEGQTFLGLDGQRELFKGCVYVLDRHRALIPGGALIRPEQFRATFGGYCFAMDAVNERTTRNAWEAFTESQALRAPRADTICFRPDLTPGAIIDDAGRRRVNAYWPASVRRLAGDVSPFLDHLARILPVERDRQIVLSYMAACVQHKGVKFGWMPVLQGCEGNGKTILSVCVAEAVGHHFTHWVDADGIASQFNGWIADKLFVAIEELRGQEHSAEEVVEKLKVLITGGFGIQVQYKGVDQTTMAIVANFMATTNYKNSVRKTDDNARRLCVFFTAQQSKADISRAGMGGEYFPKLWAWLRADGFAIVSEYLATYQIVEEFNPATMAHRAPDTSSTAEAIVESRGSVEQHIAEAIAQDTPGFMGGWVSSVMLDKLLGETLKMGGRFSHSKRREMLQSMGYVLHPGLHDGRVNNTVMPDNRKPQLFVRADHPAATLRGAAEIAKAYSAAQMAR